MRKDILVQKLFDVCRSGDIDAVHFLLSRLDELEEGMAPGVRNKGGVTPLHWACIHNLTETARLLLERGADVNTQSTGEHHDTPLHSACMRGYTDIVRLLIEKGADVNVKGGYGHTPLHLACMRHNKREKEIVMLLLERGAIVDALALEYASVPDNPAREEILDLFRQYAPEQVMEAYCSPGPGGGR